MIKNIIFCLIFFCCSSNAIVGTIQSTFITQAETYLNSLHNVSAIFVQESNGQKQYGNFMLSNSHNVRWEYKKPRNVVITFCNNKIAYHDKDLGNTEIYSIDNPFIEFIATRPISLKSHKTFFVKEIKDKSTTFEITISNVKKSVGSFILVFNKKPIQLKALVLFDDFGNPIEISLSNIITYQKSLSRPLFHCGIKNE